MLRRAKRGGTALSRAGRKAERRAVKGLLDPFSTERFRIEALGRWRTFQQSYAWTKDPELIRSYSGSGAPRTRWQWYKEMLRPNERTKFVHAIRPLQCDAPIGLHLIEFRPYRTAYFGVVIHDRAWWGKGAVEEVRRGLIDRVLEHAPVDRFCAHVHARNFASVFNYRKLGFRHVGTLHRAKADPESGEIHDTLIFELFREEWLARKEAPDA